jgi:hypothetical protein
MVTNTVKVENVSVKMVLLVQTVNVLHVNAIHWAVHATLPAIANVKLGLRANYVMNMTVTTIALVLQHLTEQLVAKKTNKLVICVYVKMATLGIAVKQLPAVPLILVCHVVAVVPATKAKTNAIVSQDGLDYFALKS